MKLNWMYRRGFLTLLSVVATFIFTACATTSAGDFPSIKVGMEKSEVVERMGSPFRSERENGNDTWIYRFYEDTSKYDEKVVIFENGRVVYSGEPISHESVLKGMPTETRPAPKD